MPRPSIISLRTPHPGFLGRKSYLKTLGKELLSKRWSLQGNFPLKLKVLMGNRRNWKESGVVEKIPS